MSGGGGQNQTPNLQNFPQVMNPQTAAAQAANGGAVASAANNATASGTAGAVGNMPTWQKGLYGAMTGNSAFGQNAPAIHQLLTSGMQMMQGQGQGGQMQRPMQRPMGPMAAPPGIAASPQPQMPQAGPMGGPPPQGGMNPQQLQQLMQTNPQLAQQILQQMQGGQSNSLMPR